MIQKEDDPMNRARQTIEGIPVDKLVKAEHYIEESRLGHYEAALIKHIGGVRTVKGWYKALQDLKRKEP